MKKSVLSFLLLFVAFSSFAQVKDTVISEQKVNGIWVKNGLDIQTLNASCDLTSNLFQVWNEGSQSYINAALSTFMLDNTGAVTGALSQNWDAANNVWVNSGRVSYTYSDDGLHFTNIGQAWDLSTNSWKNNYRILVTYNPDGTTRASEFDFSDGTNWLPQARTYFTYDAKKRVIDFVYQVYSNNAWVNSSRSVNDYSEKGLSFNYYWDTFNNQWVKLTRSFNKYVGATGLLTKQLLQYDTGIDWQDQFRQATTYNASNMLTNNQGDFWDVVQQKWNKGFRSAQEYYEDGSQQSFKFESWDANANIWAFGYRAAYTNNACGTKLVFTPPIEISNTKTNIFDAGRYGANPVIPNRNTGHYIVPHFNMQMSMGKTSVYDFAFTSGEKQFVFSLGRKSMMKPRAANAAISSNITLQGNNKVLLSPNPAKSYFTLDLSAYKTQGNVLLRLADVSGRNIMQQNVKAGSVQNISLPYLQNGMYLVTIIAGKEIITQKLMIQ